MGLFLGIDTSNYTTSAALFDPKRMAMETEGQALPVEQGQLGLRQQDAVFSHIKQLPFVMERLRKRMPGKILAVGVSTRPRDAKDSYMPCFLVGETVASVAALSLAVPLYAYSHQGGHIAAAIWGAKANHLFEQRFCAFHVSGGTTECVYVDPAETGVSTEYLAGSLDLKAGQAVDRVARLLGLSFPGGRELEMLANESTAQPTYRVSAKGGDISLSGLENQCIQLREKGAPDCDVAKLCIVGIVESVRHMAHYARERHPGLPLLFAGGVSGNAYFQQEMSKLGNVYFAPPTFCGDNGAGLAILAARRWLYEGGCP